MAYLEGINTLAEVRRAILKRAEDEQPRAYIGGSCIGNDCSRQIWYMGNGIKGKPWPIEALLKFEDGHRTEQLIIDRLRLLPQIKITGQQAEFDFGFLKGHLDGIITGLCESPNTPHVLEVKAVDETGFNKLKKAVQVHGEKQALKHWEPRYYGQAAVYMHCMDMTRHYLVCATPGGRDMQAVRTCADPALGRGLIEKARRIAQSKEPPEKLSQRPDHWQCRLCKYSEVCHK